MCQNKQYLSEDAIKQYTQWELRLDLLCSQLFPLRSALVLNVYEVNGQKEKKKKENIDKVNAQLSTEEVFKHTV